MIRSNDVTIRWLSVILSASSLLFALGAFAMLIISNRQLAARVSELESRPAETAEIPQHLSLRGLEIVDTHGRPRIKLETFADEKTGFDIGHLVVLGPTKAPRFDVMANKDGCSLHMFGGDRNWKRIQMEADPEGSVIELLDKEEKSQWYEDTRP